MMMTIDNKSNGNDRLRYRPLPPLSGVTAAETFLPMYSSAFTNPDLVTADSVPVNRKRSRVSSSMCPLLSDAKNIHRNSMDSGANFTFLGEYISSQIRQQQFEIDQFVTQHAEKLRVEIEERRRRNSRKLISAMEEDVTHILRAKEDELMKMSKLNYALEEKLKSLCIENQIWRKLAETNEATANALRTNLKQVLEQLVHGDRNMMTAGEEDAAESCCESNNERTLAEQDNSNRLCKSCWEAESCVLLLPCRHLCLCSVCGSSVHICPICKSSKNISVHVHMA